MMSLWLVLDRGV